LANWIQLAFVVAFSIVIKFISMLEIEVVIDFVGVREVADPAHPVGSLPFLVITPSKRHRFGIKTFVICCCETRFMMDFTVYTGANTEIIPDSELGVSGAVIQTLMEKYLQKGHTLWVDNWYSNPPGIRLSPQKQNQHAWHSQEKSKGDA
jgi:hypothetical protein